MNRRVMIFIDGSNFYHGIRDVLGRVNIDYQCLVKKLIDKRDLVRVYYYIPIINRDEAEEQFKMQQKFLAYLQDIPYFHIKYGQLVRQGLVLVEKRIDVQIAVDMVRYAAQDYLDVAILISGDRDFVPAVEAVKDMGKQVELAFFASQTSTELRNISDIFIDLSRDFLYECIIPKVEHTVLPEGNK